MWVMSERVGAQVETRGFGPDGFDQGGPSAAGVKATAQQAGDFLSSRGGNVGGVMGVGALVGITGSPQVVLTTGIIGQS